MLIKALVENNVIKCQCRRMDNRNCDKKCDLYKIDDLGRLVKIKEGEDDGE